MTAVANMLLFNPLIHTFKPQSNMVHWPLMGGLLHLVHRGGAWAGCPQSSPILAVPNVTAHLSTASVPTSYYSMCHYNYLCTLKG